MKRQILMMALVVTLLFAVSAFGSPLRLEYSVTEDNGNFDYDFELILDNNDGQWVFGDGWGYIIFGDQENGPSPLLNFAATNVEFIFSGTELVEEIIDDNGREHNGYALIPISEDGLTQFWLPNGVNDFIDWQGTADVDLLQGELLFSTLEVTPGAEAAIFEVASRIPNHISEPATFLLVAAGLFGLAGLSRRKFK